MVSYFLSYGEIREDSKTIPLYPTTWIDLKDITEQKKLVTEV